MPAPEKKGILEFLDFNNTLKTPVFQRSFAWERAQVDDFWNDLKRALDAPTGPEDYFLGLMVLDDTDQIQDGQQRLATTLLLAAEMHQLIEAAKAVGPHDEQVAIDAAAQISSALRQSPSAPLVISVQDQDVLLNRAGIRSDLPESAKRLDAARKRLRKHLEDDLKVRTTSDARLGRLKQWGEFLRTRSYTVLLRVPPKDAHNIFETLNTRGVRLSNGDLVKSHLIARATDTELAVGKWNQITDALKDANGKYEDDLGSFLLHYYGSRYGRTTKAEFFTDYRAAIENSDALSTLDELLESAHLYRALAEPGAAAAFWLTLGAGTQQAADLLNGLGLKQLRYLLLAVLRDFARTQASGTRRRKQRDAMLKIAAWSVRGLVHAKTGGGEAERTYINAAAEMMAALLAGERDPKVLAQMARGRLRAKLRMLEEAFTGYFTDHHAFLLAKMLARVDQINADVAELDAKIEAEIAPFARAVERLDEIPGVGPTAAHVLVSEIGLDMGRFPTPAHLASWARFAPTVAESAGKKKGKSSTGHGNPYLARVLGEIAVSAGRTDTFLGERYRRIARRRGKKKAIVAVGRSVLVIIWHLLCDPDVAFHDLGPDFYDTRINPDHKRRQHIRQLEALGYKVTLEPAA